MTLERFGKLTEAYQILLKAGDRAICGCGMILVRQVQRTYNTPVPPMPDLPDLPGLAGANNLVLEFMGYKER